MFETLFKYPRVPARHREGPVADARERFLTHCAEQGLAREAAHLVIGDLHLGSSYVRVLGKEEKNVNARCGQ